MNRGESQRGACGAVRGDSSASSAFGLWEIPAMAARRDVSDNRRQQGFRKSVTMSGAPNVQDLTPRKRPAQSRSRNMMALILEAAAYVLEERGLEGYTTNAIAERAGISVGSLYQYYPKKEAITAALILQNHEQMFRVLGEIVASTKGQSLTDASWRLIEAALSLHAARPKLSRCLELEEARLPRTRELDQVEAGIEGQMVTWLRRYLTAELSDEEVHLIASDTVSITRGIFDNAFVHGSSKLKLHERVQSAVLGYLGPLVQPD